MQRCFPLAQMNPGLRSLVALVPVSYEVWKDVRTAGAVQLSPPRGAQPSVNYTPQDLHTTTDLPICTSFLPLIFQGGFHLPCRILNSLCSVVVCVRECIFLLLISPIPSISFTETHSRPLGSPASQRTIT